MTGSDAPNGAPASAGASGGPGGGGAGSGSTGGAGGGGAGSGSTGGAGGSDPLSDVVAGTGTGVDGGVPDAPSGLVFDLATEMADAAVDLAAAQAAAEVEVDLEVAGVARERDEYLDALRRLQADFENYKKRVEKQKIEHVERAAGELVSKLLPVCDTADLAIAHGGGEEVKQVWTALFDALEREGLERIDPVGVAFDPTVHDAVAHDPGESSDGPEVVEVLRAGYRWKGRVLRPAMVKVRG
jgi:molecular chaperone GrpE